MAGLLKPFALFLFAVAWVAGSVGAQQPAPDSTGSPAAASRIAPTTTPSPTVSPVPSVPASPAPSPTPTVLMLAPGDPPQILWYSMSSTTPHPGDVVSGIVLTSSNVASVELRIGGFSINLPKTDVGRFEGSYRVPSLPFFISHRLTVLVIARNTAGAAIEEHFQMQIR